MRYAFFKFRIEVTERDLKTLTEEFRVLKEKNRRLRYRVSSFDLTIKDLY